jgi:hypothetical protein
MDCLYTLRGSRVQQNMIQSQDAAVFQVASKSPVSSCDRERLFMITSSWFEYHSIFQTDAPLKREGLFRTFHKSVVSAAFSIGNSTDPGCCIGVGAYDV